jgi:hypothetical protein
MPQAQQVRDSKAQALNPRRIGPGQPVPASTGFADHVQAHRPGNKGGPVPGLLGEPESGVGRYDADVTGHGGKPVLKGLLGGLHVGCCNRSGDGSSGRVVGTDDATELSFRRLPPDHVDPEEPGGLAR